MSVVTPKITISDAFDGGNIVFVEQRTNAADPTSTDVVLQIKPDLYTELEGTQHMQYFSFQATVDVGGGAKDAFSMASGYQVHYRIENASDVSYPEAWTGTTVCYSHELEHVDSYKRVDNTRYVEGHLCWDYTHSQHEKTVYFCYFPPFSRARHEQLIADCRGAATEHTDGARVVSLGTSLQGRSVDCVVVGTGELTAWIIHRQHPGETMAEHFAQGLLNRLLSLETATKDKESNNTTIQDTDEATKHAALEQFTFYIVPCMCPDGAVLGHLRTNACGANLNREWASKGNYQAPTLERSPEVHCVLQKMNETGVDFFLDVHGDEELPYNFLSGAEHGPNWGPRLQALHGLFAAGYARTNSDMQRAIGYPPADDPNQVLNYMNVATNQVCNRFNCLAITLEMPFKDCLSSPDPERGWTPARSRKLGASVLEALLYVQPYLRASNEFWHDLSEEDAYVAPNDDYQTLDDAAMARDDGFKMLKKRYYSDVHEIHKKAGF
jgi:murein tripeptide amidase MpaA